MRHRPIGWKGLASVHLQHLLAVRKSLFQVRRTITVQANPPDGVPASSLRDQVVSRIEEMQLPPGHTIEWGGEFESSRDAQMSLIPGIIPALVVVAITIIALFNAFRPPLIIVCVIPFAMIGVTVGLLVTGQPFGFLALLGAMSLSGMMTKNAIVLLDQINIEKGSEKSDYQAVPVTGVEHDRVEGEHSHSLGFRILTGFPSRYFLRLDPR